ncbi:MAG: prepilin peptidase [Clostridia bacterium]|nr:prepilin peptidase [Clostridia bacterium]
MLYIISFIYGLLFGSFLNVCIYRMPANKSIVKPPSACPKCHYQLRWYDNIPVLSFIFLGGKCRYCKNEISIR